MNTLKQTNWKIWTLAILIGVAATVVPGCVREWIKVEPPQRAVDEGVPASLSLNDSKVALSEYRAEKQLILDAWSARENIAESKAQFWEGAIGAAVTPESLTLFGLNPVGGAGAMALFLGGLLIKRPGDVKGSEKIDSYNKGKDTAKELIDIAYNNGRLDAQNQAKETIND